MEFAGVASVWSRGTIHLPKELVEKLGLSAGGTLLVFLDRGRSAIILKPARSVELAEDGSVVFKP